MEPEQRPPRPRRRRRPRPPRGHRPGRHAERDASVHRPHRPGARPRLRSPKVLEDQRGLDDASTNSEAAAKEMRSASATSKAESGSRSSSPPGSASMGPVTSMQAAGRVPFPQAPAPVTLRPIPAARPGRRARRSRRFAPALYFRLFSRHSLLHSSARPSEVANGAAGGAPDTTTQPAICLGK